MLPRMFFQGLLAFLPLSFVAISLGDDPKSASKIVPAAEAKDHLDKECTVEMTVLSSKNAEKSKVFYLDSEKDFRDPKNAVVVISYDHLDAFKKAGIDDPSTHYLNKTIRVLGTPKKVSDQVRIRVEDPKKIEVLKNKKGS
ncbi:MAG: hypothetical protein JWN86_3185 [Planctomycetota bacterium]|nr:hypothetical protein [Planctomycetota bacterium]